MSNVKRRIERVLLTVQTATTTSVLNNTLHACEDSKTLIRILIDGYWVHALPTVAGSVQARWHIQVAPSGVNVFDPADSELLDQPVPVQFIASGTIKFMAAVSSAVGIANPASIPLYRDIKAMRKLAEADNIVFSLIADGSSEIFFYGDFHLWFKE